MTAFYYEGCVYFRPVTITLNFYLKQHRIQGQENIFLYFPCSFDVPYSEIDMELGRNENNPEARFCNARVRTVPSIKSLENTRQIQENLVSCQRLTKAVSFTNTEW